MNARLHCERCGAELTGQVVSGMCANCLLTLANRPSPENALLLPLEGEVTEFSTSSDRPHESRPVRGFGDYEVLERIGHGGMGVVYKARQKSLNRLVALKMVHNFADASLDTLIRFRIEAEAAGKLDHPNIVPTYQTGEIDGRPFFSMKLVTGMSLAKKFSELALPLPGGDGMARPARSSTREAQAHIATLLAKVARAVHYAHQHGVIHRDLKPNNILLDTNGEPHLTDFGIAKLLEHDIGLTHTNDLLGTPAYMAPEQAAGKNVSASVDIYSLGAILYELLTGRPPFKGKTPIETLRRTAEEEPTPPTTINGSADDELAAICVKCLEKNPTRRYGSALEMADDLERWIRHEPIQAKRIGPVGRTIRWARRNRAGALLILTLFTGLAGALVLLDMVNAEKEKTAVLLREREAEGRTNAQLFSLTVAMLHEQLEGLWLSRNSRVLHISSDQLAVLSGSPIVHVANKSSIERFTFGLAANESPVADSRRYAPLLRHLEVQLSERRARPVRIDLKIFKFKEDRVQALVTNGIDLARMGDAYFLRTQQDHPGIRALVEARNRVQTNVFFSRRDTGIRTLADLKGRSVAFGDAVAGVTFWGKVKLLEAGITGPELKKYTHLDSRTEFVEEVHELGFDEALKRRGWLHSTADVIDEVASGRYDAGVTSLGGFKRHQDRGLVRIPGSEFERSRSPWVASARLSPDAARDFIEVFSLLRDEPFLLVVPSHPSEFTPITDHTYHSILDQIRRVDRFFPMLPAASTETGHALADPPAGK